MDECNNQTIFQDEIELLLLSEIDELKTENELLKDKIEELEERVYCYEYKNCS